jgi:hypothetical protein
MGIAMRWAGNTDSVIQSMVDEGANLRDFFCRASWPLWWPRKPFQGRHTYNFQAADQKILRWLLKVYRRETGKFVAANGMTPLGMAVEMGDASLVDELLIAGANPWQAYRDLRVDRATWRYPIDSVLKRNPDGSADISNLRMGDLDAVVLGDPIVPGARHRLIKYENRNGFDLIVALDMGRQDEHPEKVIQM